LGVETDLKSLLSLQLDDLLVALKLIDPRSSFPDGSRIDEFLTTYCQQVKVVSEGSHKVGTFFTTFPACNDTTHSFFSTSSGTATTSAAAAERDTGGRGAQGGFKTSLHL
jgi:hypothetical protein